MRRSDDSNRFTGYAESRRVFISFARSDKRAVQRFVKKWSVYERVFGYLGIGIFPEDPPVIDSDDAGYIMRKIRQRYMRQTNVTIVLLGTGTHKRKYVDWEIKGTLDPGVRASPNGLLGISLQTTTPTLPDRLELNVDSGFASVYLPPMSSNELGMWIDAAYQSRLARAHMIRNPRALKMRNN